MSLASFLSSFLRPFLPLLLVLFVSRFSPFTLSLAYLTTFPFPIPLFLSVPTHARSSLLVYKTTGSLLCPALFWMMAHLSIGDTWNTINNVDNRLGSAFGGVLFVWGSVVYTTYQVRGGVHSLIALSLQLAH